MGPVVSSHYLEHARSGKFFVPSNREWAEEIQIFVRTRRLLETAYTLKGGQTLKPMVEIHPHAPVVGPWSCEKETGMETESESLLRTSYGSARVVVFGSSIFKLIIHTKSKKVRVAPTSCLWSME